MGSSNSVERRSFRAKGARALELVIVLMQDAENMAEAKEGAYNTVQSRFRTRSLDGNAKEPMISGHKDRYL